MQAERGTTRRWTIHHAGFKFGRLFEGVDMRASGYECTQFAASEKATHVVLTRKAQPGA